MAKVVTPADVMVARDAWDVAVTRQRTAEAAWDRNPCEFTNAAVAATRKAQVRAWAAWNRAEQQVAA